MLCFNKQQHGLYRCNQDYADIYSVCNCLHAEYCLNYNLKYLHSSNILSQNYLEESLESITNMSSSVISLAL